MSALAGIAVERSSVLLQMPSQKCVYAALTSALPTVCLDFRLIARLQHEFKDHHEEVKKKDPAKRTSLFAKTRCSILGNARSCTAANAVSPAGARNQEEGVRV